MSEKVTPEKVKELREKTGVGMSHCKNALDQAGGDLQKAIDLLRKAGMTCGVKREGRETKEGFIFAHEAKDAIGLIEINSETDFVAQSEKFKKFLSEVALLITETKVQKLQDLLEKPSKEDKTLTVEQQRNVLVQTFGENIQIKRMELIAKAQNTSYGIYFHMGGKLVTIVALEGALGEEALAREVAMHVAAEHPEYLKPEEVPLEIKKREEDIARSQMQGKPANIVEKILEGKMNAFYDTVCLGRQKFIKDNSLTVQQYVEDCGKKKGKSLIIQKFWRWKVGQS